MGYNIEKKTRVKILVTLSLALTTYYSHRDKTCRLYATVCDLFPFR